MNDLEPLNRDYDEKAVIMAVETALTAFYDSLTHTLDNINIEQILKRKNPYLYRAKGICSAAQIVEEILSAYVSSSEETTFGNTFFEPITLALSGGYRVLTEGVDILVEKDNATYGISVKSGTSINAGSRKRQEQNLQAMQRRIQKYKKAFVPVVGYGYGRKKIKPGKEKFYRELAGKDFWHWLTGDSEFYVKIIRFMGTRPDEYAKEFEKAYTKAENRLLREFMLKYCDADGAIDWDALIRFNSGD